MISKTARSAGTALAAAACLLPLVPVLIEPGMGVLVSLAIAVIGLVMFPSSRGPTLAMVWKGRIASIVLGVLVGGALAWSIANFVRPLVEGWLGKGVNVAGLEQVAGNQLLFAFTLVIALASAVLEEVIFRGYVIGWGAKIFGKGAAVLVMLLSSAVFGFAHWGYGQSGAVVTGFAGLVLGTLYLACGRRLLPSIMAHVTFNAIGSTALFLS